jgi:ribosomal protein S12 methylthiotransferase
MSDVAIVTLGCPKNAVDSENLGGLVAAGGHALVEDPEAADVVMVNTCGFIDPARRETVEEILELADLKDKHLKGLVLTGCLVARSASDLVESLPEVDALVDFAAYPLVADIVSQVAAGTNDQKIFGDPGNRFDPAWWDASMAASPRLRFGRAPWAYVKIAEGCDRGCTFCAIPLMRGKLRSRTPDSIEAEARHLASLGVSELSLVSQDSVMYGRDIDAGDLMALLKRLEKIDGLRRIRLMYLHPQGVTDELIDFMASSERLAHYFDLSLQHVSPSVLRGMGRWGGRERFEHQIERIRARDPLAAIRSTFILGFPGETDRDAADVAEFVADNALDWVGVFTYSREEDTRSHDMADQVPAEVARERADAAVRAAEQTMSRRAEAYVGKELDVLVDRFDLDEATWIGRSHREAPEIDGEIVLGASTGLSVGDFLRVEVTGTVGSDLTGRRVSVRNELSSAAG